MRRARVIRKAALLSPGIHRNCKHRAPSLQPLPPPDKHRQAHQWPEKKALLGDEACFTGCIDRSGRITALRTANQYIWMRSPALNAVGLISVYAEQWAEMQSPHSRSPKTEDCLLQQLCWSSGRPQGGPFPRVAWGSLGWPTAARLTQRTRR